MPANAPDFLTSDEGETVFVRRDSARTISAALQAALHEGYNLGGMEAEKVLMLPVPEHFHRSLGVEWAVVPDGTPGGVGYWRFAL